MRWREAETPWVDWLVALIGVAFTACAAPAREYGEDTTTTAATSTSIGAGTGGSTTSSISTGGGGGGSPAAASEDVTAFVSGGVVASNGKHRMVLSVGEAAPVQRTMKSTKHRLQGGLVGATE